MTTDKKNELREHMSMRAFTFYLDDITKVEVLRKLRENSCDQAKGTLAALIRVLLSRFAELDDEQSLKEILAEVEKEYTFTTKKNKRSSM